jgi:hypothetical protein
MGPKEVPGTKTHWKNISTQPIRALSLVTQHHIHVTIFYNALLHILIAPWSCKSDSKKQRAAKEEGVAYLSGIHFVGVVKPFSI